MTKRANPTRSQRAGSGHSYFLDGEKVPGVTTIIGAGIPKPALENWAANTTSEYVLNRLRLDDGHVIADELVTDLRAFNETSKYPERLGDGLARIPLAKVLSRVRYAERDAAANRGREVHELAERLAAGDEVEIPEPLTGHVNAYVRFLDEWDLSDAVLERVVINRRWRYMGRFDLLADMPALRAGDLEIPPGRALLDIKTNRGGVYPETALQLAAYRFSETMIDPDGSNPEPMPEVEWCGVVWVRADGYDLIPIPGADREAFRLFLAAKKIGEAFDRDAVDNWASTAIAPAARPLESA